MEPLKKLRRRGIGAVEAALLLPILLILTFGGMEYGWCFLKQQQIVNCSRQAARTAALAGSTNAQVTSLVSSMMTTAGMGSSGYTLSTSPANISTAAAGSTVTVTISVSYPNVHLTSMTLFPQPATLTAATAMAKEGP